MRDVSQKIAFVVAIMAALVSPAAAEDDIQSAGLYVGVSGYWGNGTRDIKVPNEFNPCQNPDRFGYGATGIVGYNWRSGPLVFGVEADAGWGTIQPRMTYYPRQRQRRFTSTRPMTTRPRCALSLATRCHGACWGSSQLGEL
jgi:opacity protein-like surface antigen